MRAAGRLVICGGAESLCAANKPPDIVAAMSDPEGRKTLKKMFAGISGTDLSGGESGVCGRPGLIFLTNDGTSRRSLLEELGKSGAGVSHQNEGDADALGFRSIGKENSRGGADADAAQPDASRGSGEFLVEVRMRDSNKENLRRILMKETASDGKN